MGHTAAIHSAPVGQTANPSQNPAAFDTANLHLLNSLGGTQPSLSRSSINKSLVQLAELLGALQKDIVNLMATTSKLNYSIGNELIEEATNQVNAAIKQVSKVASEHQEHHWWDVFAEIVGVIVGAILTIAGAITADPVMAVAGVAVIIFSTTPALQDIASAIASVVSDGLQACGMSKKEADKVAKVIADVIVIILLVVIMVASCGSSAAGDAAVAARTSMTATETVGEEMTELSSVASSAVDGASTTTTAASTASTAAEETSALSRVGQVLKTLNPLSRLSRAANAGIFGATQGISGTGLINDTIEMVMALKGQKQMSEAEQKLALALGIINSILSVLSGGAAMGSAVASTGRFAKLLQSIKTSMMNVGGSGAKIFNALYFSEIVGTLLQVTGQVGQGLVDRKLAESLASLTSHQASLNLLQFFDNLMSSLTADMVKQGTAGSSSISNDLGNLPSLTKMDQELAQLLA